MNKNLVIFGTGEAAELAHYYFTTDSSHHVAAFTVDKAYVTRSEFCGMPVVSFEDVARFYPPDTHDLFVSIGYSKLNEIRKRKYLEAKAMGYRMASYVSSRASVMNDGRVGENCFILEDNTVQPFVRIGHNVTLWSGNHIGHHSVVGDHTFIASHAVISGNVEIGAQCFIGVNAALRDGIKIGERCVIGAGALLLADAAAEGVYLGQATERSKVPSSRLRSI